MEGGSAVAASKPAAGSLPIIASKLDSCRLRRLRKYCRGLGYLYRPIFLILALVIVACASDTAHNIVCSYSGLYLGLQIFVPYKRCVCVYARNDRQHAVADAHTNTCVYVYTHMQMITCSSMYLCIYIYIRMYIHMYINIHMQKIYVYTYRS